MKKLNDVVYNKLLLQAEEAKEQGKIKLAKVIMGSLTPSPEEGSVKYSVGELNDDVYAGLWKIATDVMKYYDVESADAEKIDEVIEALASTFISEIEKSLSIDSSTIGPLEPELPGQK